MHEHTESPDSNRMSSTSNSWRRSTRPNGSSTLLNISVQTAREVQRHESITLPKSATIAATNKQKQDEIIGGSTPTTSRRGTS